MADNDGTDILKCRWSNSNAGTNYNRLDECRGACLGLNGISTLSEENCTLVFTLPSARSGWYFVVALQIEDYYSSSSTAPMSSVPVQFLFYAYTPSGSCTTRPAIIGDRPNRGTSISTRSETQEKKRGYVLYPTHADCFVLPFFIDGIALLRMFFFLF